MPTITICASAAFYEQVVAVQAQLKKAGFEVLIPDTAKKMQQSGNFDVAHYKPWHTNTADYHQKAALIRGHFAKVAQGDAVLVLNYDKHGIKNYVGGNVLIEMGLAFYLKKPIFMLNEAPENSPLKEEILGLEPTILHSNINAIIQHYS